MGSLSRVPQGLAALPLAVGALSLGTGHPRGLSKGPLVSREDPLQDGWWLHVQRGILAACKQRLLKALPEQARELQAESRRDQASWDTADGCPGLLRTPPLLG